MFKFIIAILLIGVLISLFSGLFFLVKDEGKTKRLANSLTVRVTLAALLVIVVIIGIQTGELQFNASPINAF